MDNLTELEELLAKEMKSQGVSLQGILMIMDVLRDEESQETFGHFLVSIRGLEVPEWKVIIVANSIAAGLMDLSEATDFL